MNFLRDAVMHCRRPPVRVLSLLMTALFLCWLSGIAVAQSPANTNQGRIVFTTDRDGNKEIYSANRDGSRPRRLTNNSFDDYEPAWSPDGSKIAFTSRRDGHAEIYVMDADGTNQTRLTTRTPPTDISTSSQPAWSPDGKQIAFTRDLNLRGTSPGIYVMQADGSNPQRLTDHAALDDMPSWSPDGKQIAFRSNRQGARSDIFVMNADGSGQTIIPTPELSIVQNPAWSPDGTRIAFNGSPVSGEGGIFVANIGAGGGFFVWKVFFTTSLDSQPTWGADSEELLFLRYGASPNGDIYFIRFASNPPTPVINHPAFDGQPDWGRPSAASGKIGFISERDGNKELYSMQAGGSEQRNLSNTAALQEKTLAWSPDGLRVAFLRQSDDNLYVMNADGSNVVKLTNNDFQHIQITNLTWSPDATRIAYISGSDLVHYLTVVNADGTNRRTLLEINNPYLDLSWSPDGTRIAFSQGLGFNQSNLYVMNADGSGLTKVTDDNESGVYNRSVAWSPDGWHLAFESNRDGNDEIYVLTLARLHNDFYMQRLTRLTNHTASDTDPTWSPDGSRLAFSTNRDGNHEIYTMNRGGGDLKRLTTNSVFDGEPDWQPAGGPPPPRKQSSVQFSRSSYRVFEDGSTNGGSGLSPHAEITVTRTGELSGVVSVDYETSDGTASGRTDYTPLRGTLRFEAGQSARSFTVPVTYDSFVEGNETVNLTLTGVNGTFDALTGTQDRAQLVISDFYPGGTPTGNAIDIQSNFVRQHYHDFFNREPDAEGLAFWTGQITACGSDAACIARKRVDVSGSFFLSIEFQETGYFLYRLQLLTYGTQPRFTDFMRDVQRLGQGVIVNVGNWKEQLEQNKLDFVRRWTQTTVFINTCGGKPNAQFVDQILANVRFNVTPQLRNHLIAELDAGKSYADILREVVDLAEFRQSELTRAFVLMQYFGYLRRDPDAAPDNNMDGYNFWLTKLNNHGGDFRRAEMVKAFITSGEYRSRFGQ